MSTSLILKELRKLRPDEYPTLKLPLLAAQVSVPPPRRELVRHDLPVKKRKCYGEVETSSDILYCDAQTNTELTWLEIEDMEEELHATKKEIEEYKAECSILKQKQHLRLSNVQEDDEKVRFYTGFSSYAALMVCFNFLGKGSSKLNYWGSTMFEAKTDKGRKRALLPLEEFLNQARAWFLEITFVRTSVCVFVCVCVRPRGHE